ncbi:hypothetical protein RJ639_038751 [Escallonia herrerae]|uniref:Biotin carboxyl carrier protein of acetyl-CoA carboxylase n=1 Tax=Escallonia herrerae TaxID=1293975 RepID=A0AA88WLZ9_9ASTE|nr:hypothetical protein RJ639_038751 [Escallonia herrerae]
MASFSVPCPKTTALLGSLQANQKQSQQSRPTSVLFRSDSVPNRALLAGSSQDCSSFRGVQASSQNQHDAFRVSAQLNEVAVEKSSNSAPVIKTESEKPTEKAAHQTTIPDASSISAFMNQVAVLVECVQNFHLCKLHLLHNVAHYVPAMKLFELILFAMPRLVDSRDIMELQLKQLDCEVLIRKKEALPPPPAAPYVVMQSPPPQAMVPSQFPPAQVAAAPAPTSPPVSAPALPAPAKPTSSHPPLKCPMAGTFYRCPAPGAPPFVKVGDKVQKGQVICIIEAMKLMNDIEADQSGTVVATLVDDGKPVSVDMPLFIIEP